MFMRLFNNFQIWENICSKYLTLDKYLINHQNRENKIKDVNYNYSHNNSKYINIA